MKKLISALITLSLTLSLLTLPALADSPIIPGDADNNGVVNVADIIAIRDHILGKRSLCERGKIAADVNEIGIVNIFSMVAVREVILKEKEKNEKPTPPSANITVEPSPNFDIISHLYPELYPADNAAMTAWNTLADLRATAQDQDYTGMTDIEIYRSIYNRYNDAFGGYFDVFCGSPETGFDLEFLWYSYGRDYDYEPWIYSWFYSTKLFDLSLVREDELAEVLDDKSITAYAVWYDELTSGETRGVFNVDISLDELIEDYINSPKTTLDFMKLIYLMRVNPYAVYEERGIVWYNHIPIRIASDLSHNVMSVLRLYVKSTMDVDNFPGGHFGLGSYISEYMRTVEFDFEEFFKKGDLLIIMDFDGNIIKECYWIDEHRDYLDVFLEKLREAKSKIEIL
ncbi:MAG: dockerin type I repeat-containing protein [Oscillospiraceae bacterium]|nr:dockerin type I repeat-containing protein [Oscillospiraceae bacterium]